MKNNKNIGRKGENAAARYLKKQGYKILERNIHMSHEEIDIIAKDGEHILFVEVKTRTEGADETRFGRPAAAVTKEKQRHILSAAREYLKQNPTFLYPRMDVCEVWVSKGFFSRVTRLNYIPGAYTQS